MANNVIEALQLLVQRGVEIPTGLKIINDHCMRVLDNGAAARFAPDLDQSGIPILTKPGTIYLNPLYPWEIYKSLKASPKSACGG